MKKKLMAKYVMAVYSDGSIEQTLLEKYEIEDGETSGTGEVSARITQIMDVISEWVRLKNTKDMSEVMTSEQIMNTVIRKVSEKQNVTYQTIADKISRQGFGKMEQVVQVLESFHNAQGNDNDMLKGRLKAIASKRSEIEDRRYISKLIEELKEKYYKG